MSYTAICKKLKWSQWERKMAQQEINYSWSMMPRAKRKAYISLKDFAALDYERYTFDVSKYIKKGLRNDVIKVAKTHDSGFYKIKSITLYKNVLDKMYINALSRFIIDAEYSIFIYKDFFYTKTYQENLKRANKIFSVMGGIYTPKHESIFVGLKSEKLEKNADIFLLSAILFFLDHLHDFFLNLLKDYSSIKISMYDFELLHDGFFQISYKEYKIQEKDFRKKTNIFSNDGQLIEKIKNKLDNLTSDFRSYVSNNTEEEIAALIDSDTLVILRNIALHAFVIYTLAYIHNVLDLPKLFNDVKLPSFASFSIELTTSGKLTFANIAKDSLLSKLDIVRDSLLSKFLLDEKNGTIEQDEYLFFTLSDNLITIRAKSHRIAASKFLMQKKGGKKESPFFFLEKGVSEKDFKVHVPLYPESLLFFFKTISKDRFPLDFMYEVAMFMFP